MIRLAKSGNIADPKWKAEILEEAFHIVADAQQPVKRRYASFLQPLDTRAGYQGYAFELDLDALSLRLRAIDALLNLDKPKARQLFGENPALNLRPVGCEQSLVYDVGRFYETLAKIAQTAFTKREMQNGEHIRFLESHIGDITSPAQVAPAINAILALKPQSDTLQALIASLASALPKMSEDDRSFSFMWGDIFTAMEQLIVYCAQKEAPADGLIRVFRGFLVKQMSEHRCADTWPYKRNDDARMLELFEKRIVPKSARNIPPITTEEIKPQKIEGKEIALWYWQSPKAMSCLEALRSLRFGHGENRRERTEAEKREAKWQAELQDFLNEMAQWTKDDEKSEEDYFHQKCHLYQSLTEFVPEGPTKDAVRRTYVAFLNEYDLQRGSRIDWFWQAEKFIKSMPLLPEDRRAALFEKNRPDEKSGPSPYMELGKLTLNQQAAAKQ